MGETEYVPEGGLVEYVNRVREDHRRLPDGWCSCCRPLCPERFLLDHIDNLIKAYELKVQDLAKETARTGEAREVAGVLCEHVLTWHQVDAPDDDPGVEIPLYQHVELPTGLGELRSHTREVDEPEWCPHPFGNPFRGDLPEVSGG